MLTNRIPERLDRLPKSKFQKKLLWICGFGTLFDAIDVGIIGSVMAALIADWKLQPAQLGLIGSAGFLGMFLGAILAGPLADRFGRKIIFSFTLGWFSLFSLLNAFAWDYESMLTFRFLTGIGLGAEVPIVAAYFSELAPAKFRGRMLTMYESFFPWGLMIASIMGFLLVPSLGWPSLFVVGAIPAALIFVIRRKLPESPRWLVGRNREMEAEAIVSQLEDEVAKEHGKLTELEANSSGVQIVQKKLYVFELWNSTYIKRTIFTWICWFGVFYATYGFLLWLPSFWVKSGLSLTESLMFNILVTIVGVPGFWVIALLIDRIGRKPSLIISLLIGLIGAIGFGLSGTFDGQLTYACIAGFANSAAVACLYTYSPELFPTRIRATAVSFASSFGRIGGLVAPAVTGVVMASVGNKASVFLVVAAILVVTLIATFILAPETRLQNLEELSEVDGQQENSHPVLKM